MSRVDRRPRGAGALRLALCALVLAAVLVFVPAPSGVRAVSYSAQEVEFVQLLNAYRVSLGVDPLMVSDLASDAAEKHSSDMGTYSFFSHTTLASSDFPVGYDADKRLILCGYPSYMGWGENIAAGYSMASSVLQAWQGSSTHHQMMTYGGFKVMGIGVVYVPGSPYGYYWTVDFGIAVDSTAHWLDGSVPSTTSTSTTSATTTTTTTLPPTTTSTTSPGSTTTSTTGTTLGGPSFADVPVSHRFYEPIMRLAAAGVVNGYDDGLFYPGSPVTRAQFAKIIILALQAHTDQIENAGAPTFSDVTYAGVPYPFDYVEEAVALGIIQGYANGTFAPAADVTRLQLALMLVRAGGNRLTTPPSGHICPFTDVPEYGRDAVARALYNGVLSGKTATIFDPYSSATRGQVAKMVYGLTQLLGL